MAALLACTAALLSCAPARPVTDAAPPARERLAAAESLVVRGCLDCLVAAYGEFDALRSVPSVASAATVGATRAALLVTLRERELGMADGGYGTVARQLIAATPTLPDWLPAAAQAIDALADGIGGRTSPPASDADLDRMLRLHRGRSAWTAVLRPLAADDPLAAYTWLALACASHDGPAGVNEAAAKVDERWSLPLLAFKRAVCPTIDGPRLEHLLESEPRFVEVTYVLGLLAVAQTKLDRADDLYERAYAWRPRWPALTQAMAALAMTAEDFNRAVQLYGETLAAAPSAAEALVGLARALTYLGRHEDAIAATDRLLAAGWHVGDARYWRALNEAHLEKYDAAWADVEEASRLLFNADVPKLAGTIAYRRQQLQVAHDQFEEARRRNPTDCESIYYLGVVLVEMRAWARSASALGDAETCLDRAERDLLREIERIRASGGPPAREVRLIARRHQQAAAARRMRATSWFNLAVAYYGLSQPAEARRYAEKLLDDEQFGERARQILARLK